MIDPVLNPSYPLPEGLSSSFGGHDLPSDRARPLILGLARVAEGRFLQGAEGTFTIPNVIAKSMPLADSALLLPPPL